MSHPLRTVQAMDGIVCLGCGAWGGSGLCLPCSLGMAAGRAQRLTGGLVVRAGLRHDGTARALVHRLKYGGLRGAATILAIAMANCLPSGAAALVPVPRARLRRWRHGIDPARELAVALAARSGLPVVAALQAPWWWPRHAGADRDARPPPRFRSTTRAPPGAVLVDDVVTTGSTLTAAARALPPGTVIGAVTATA